MRSQKPPSSPGIDALLPLKPDVFQVLLAMETAPLHGYGILKQVEEATDGALRLAPSLLYRKLRRLLEDGLVVEANDVAATDSDDERRRYYALTQLGRAVLTAEASRIVTLAGSRRIRSLAKQARDA